MKKVNFFLLAIIFCGTIHKTVAQTTLTTAIDTLVSAELRNDEPGGVVLVSKQGQIIYQKPFGMADMELDVPMKEDMVFYIGSLTKQFTAVAILQLLEQGRLSLQDSIAKYIGGCSPLVSAITIEQLLTHTSGLASNPANTEGRIIVKNKTKLQELVDNYINQPPDFEAGTQWKYNNTNYSLLGHIIEKISGKPYGDYLAAYIFNPAGMHRSYMGEDAKLIKHRATGYTKTKTGVITNDRISNSATWYASGGIMSTAEDMFKWCQALRSGKLLKPETLAKAFVPYKLTNGQYTKYGYGWHLWDIHGSPSLRHGGSVRGFISESVWHPREDVYVIILLNVQSRMPVGVITRIIASMAIDKPYSFKEIATDPTLLKTYQGVYKNTWGQLIVITEMNGKLYFQRPSGTRYHIKAATKNEFFFDKDYLRVEFHSDSLDRVQRLSFGRVDLDTSDWQKVSMPIPTLHPVRLPDSLLHLYAGEYQVSPNVSIMIRKEEVGLSVQITGREKLPLLAKSEHAFFCLKEDLAIEFSSPSKNNSTKLILYEKKKKREAVKLQ